MSSIRTFQFLSYWSNRQRTWIVELLSLHWHWLSKSICHFFSFSLNGVPFWMFCLLWRKWRKIFHFHTSSSSFLFLRNGFNCYVWKSEQSLLKKGSHISQCSVWLLQPIIIRCPIPGMRSARDRTLSLIQSEIIGYIVFRSGVQQLLDSAIKRKCIMCAQAYWHASVFPFLLWKVAQCGFRNIGLKAGADLGRSHILLFAWSIQKAVEQSGAVVSLDSYWNFRIFFIS